MEANKLTPQQANELFIASAMERNYRMEATSITRAGQFIDIELDKVPGWATSIDLNVELNVTVAGSAAPTLSQFAPHNFFREVAIALGGGPFIRTNAYFYYLRELLSHRGWAPGQSALDVPYSTQTVHNRPTIVVGENKLKFTIRIPLQTQPHTTFGMMPMGSSATTLKIQISTQNNLVGTDHWYNPFISSTPGVTAQISSVTQSFVQPVIKYLTSPTVGNKLPDPKIGYVLNVQERSFPFVGAGSNTPLKFNDPFRYLRLIAIVIDGTGAPNTTAVNNWEMDLMPSFPQYQYPDKMTLSSYFYDVQRTYQTNLPPGVFVFDMYTGSDPYNPNGTQTVDATLFQTMQAQIAVDAGTNTNNPAKIIVISEALSPVNF